MRSPCLMYHQIAEDPNPGKFWVRPADYIRQLDYLVEQGFRAINLKDERPFEVKNGVLITFDDGHVSNYEASQMLRQKGLVGVFYILKDSSLHDSNSLSETQIKEIARMGHVVGIHGKDHGWWMKKDEATLVAEFNETKDWLETLTGQSVITCSAPGGMLDARTLRTIRTHLPDIKYIRNSRPWMNSGRTDLISSVAVRYDMPFAEFEREMNLDMRYYFSRRLFYEVKNVIKKALMVVGR